jgi:hypothetical protein
MGARELLIWLASLPPSARDAAFEERFAIADAPPVTVPPGSSDLIGYHPSGVAPIVRMLMEVPVREDDVLVDLGAGLGKVVLLTRLLTQATARGIELEPALVDRARLAARRAGVTASFTQGDARTKGLDDGTVFFLYLPFTGSVLREVLARLEIVASRRAIVVCSLGLDLDREAPWLERRPLDSFWLTIYDSFVPGVPPRAERQRSPSLRGPADLVAFERPGQPGEQTK